MIALWARSASLRVTVAVSALILGVALAVAALQYRTTANELQRQIEATLQADLDGFAALYAQRRVIALREAMEYRAQTDAEILTLLLDRSGDWRAGTLRAWPAEVPALGEGFTLAAAQRMEVNGAAYFGVARVLPGGFAFLVARPLAPMEAVLARLRRGIALMAAGLVVVAGAAGWLVARGLLRRIDRLNALADRVAGGDLAARIGGLRRADELGRLEVHMEAMLDRIGMLMAATRRLSNGIAHELRTPLTRLQTKLAAVDAPPAQIEALRADLKGAVRVFDSLLDIASAEAGTDRATTLDPVDLEAICGDIAELYAPLAEEEGLVLHTVIAPGAHILGDRNLVAQLVTNLLDNALKYTRRGDSVTLAVRDGGAKWELEVRDTGPGVPADLRPVLFEHFTRAPRDSHIRGHGLGLALVRAIATRHGAQAQVIEAENGFALRVGFPKLAMPDRAVRA